MANVNVRFGVTMVDELATKASTTSYVTAVDTSTAAAIEAAAQAWASALDGVSSLQLTDLRAEIEIPLPGGIKAGPAAGSRVEASAVVNLAAGVSGRKWGILIPGVLETLSNTGKLNLSDALVTTLTGLLQGAVLGGTYATPYGNALGAVIDAILSFRKHRKQLSRTSFER